MGLNLDLADIIAAPSEVKCPKCKQKTHTYFDDWDIEGSGSLVDGNELQLYCSCHHCEAQLWVTTKVKWKVSVDGA